MNAQSKTVGKAHPNQKAFGHRLLHGIFATMAIATLALATSSAHAACGLSSGMGSLSGIRMPMLQAEADDAWDHKGPTIVGLWATVYTAGGEVFNQTLDQWHSDGTEFENAFVPVLAGNICFGVWKPVGKDTVRLHHIGWTYDPVAGGVANGTFTLDETNTVAKDNCKYTGTFTFKAYDIKGNLLKTVTGTIAAVRITVD